MIFPYPGQPVIVKSSKRPAALLGLWILPVTDPLPYPGPPPIVMASLRYQDGGEGSTLVPADEIEAVYPRQLSSVEITLVDPVESTDPGGNHGNARE